MCLLVLLVPRGREGYDDQQSQDGARDMRHQLGLIERVDIVEAEFSCAQAELGCQLVHYIGVVLCYNEGAFLS